MTKIAQAFHNNKAFIAYLMAGDPDLETSADYILTAQEAGADLIEIGIPFSDPIAEGAVIQSASVRAINAGARLDRVFDMVAGIKDRLRIPVVFMTYLNPVFVFGYEAFFKRCQLIGICGIIIPDLPFEEQAEVKTAAKQYGVEVITLIAPTSQKRTATIAKNAEGFIYLVSSMGVTGVRSTITTDVGAIVADIKRESALPVAVGFGIATPDQATQFAKMADGVIVGSAIVGIIAEHGKNAKAPLFDFIKLMKQALMQLP